MDLIMFALDGSNSIPDATKRTHRLEGLRITWMASLYLWGFHPPLAPFRGSGRCSGSPSPERRPSPFRGRWSGRACVQIQPGRDGGRGRG